MIAVVVLPGPSPAMLGLDSRTPAALLPLGDRPFLQHLIEYLVAQGIGSVHLLVEHGPEAVEHLLGNGDRWGCRLRYHLLRDGVEPYRPLRVIPEARVEPWLLMHGLRFPRVSLPAPGEVPTIFRLADEDAGGWAQCALFPPGEWAERLWDCPAAGLERLLLGLLTDGSATSFQPAEWVDISTPRKLLSTQASLLRKSLSLVKMGGIERQPGVWISRNVVVDPAAELVPPVYIGPHSRIGKGARLGPEAVVAGSSIVDSDTVVEHSLILPGTYVGTSLDLREAIVDRQLLVNVALGASVVVREDFLLGGLGDHYHRGGLLRVLSCALAALLLLLLGPVWLLAALYHALVRRAYPTAVHVPAAPAESSTPQFRLPCLGSDAWTVHRPAGWEALWRQFVPGLVAVLLGRVALVGLPPRTAEELGALDPEWRDLYREARMGLISEASVAATGEEDGTQFYLCDAYYAARKSWRHDLQLALLYMRRLLPG